MSISIKVTRFRHKDTGKGPWKNRPAKAGMKEAVGKKQERMAAGDNGKLTVHEMAAKELQGPQWLWGSVQRDNKGINRKG